MMILGNITALVTLCVIVSGVSAKSLITQRANYIGDLDANGITEATAVAAATVAEVLPKEKSVQERAIDRQVTDIKKLKCKPHREKVYTADVLSSISKYSVYLDKPIFPQVLSIKKCDPNCTYCFDETVPTKAGKTNTYECKAIKSKAKKFTVQVYNVQTGNREYIKVPIDVDQKCKCVDMGNS